MPPAELGSELPASNVARLDAVMPQHIGGFTLIDRRLLPGSAGDMAYRFRDSALMNVSVFVYPADYPGAVMTGGPRQRVAHEGGLFLELLPTQVRRGVYDSFEPLVARPDSIIVGELVVPGFVSGARIRRKSTTAMEVQFLHLIGGDYVKLRAMLPESWSAAALQSLDSIIVARLVGAWLVRP
jgi:hypothetical protein